MLPNLIVIGAMKCGTSSLYHYLKEHPEIWMSQRKELDFFMKNWHRGIAWYERWFPFTVPLRGEASHTYTVFPHYRGVPERMARTLGEAKLVYLVRDPIDRFVSNYTFSKAWGYWKERLDETVGHVDSTPLGVRGRYWLQLEQYLEYFPPERILVVDHASLLHRREETLSEVFRFLGVGDALTSPRFNVVHSPLPDRRRKLPALLAISALMRVADADPAWHARAWQMRRRFPHKLFLLFSEQLQRQVLDDRQRERLVEYYAEDVARLRAFTGLAFESWSL